jgi:hypothetical protein
MQNLTRRIEVDTIFSVEGIEISIYTIILNEMGQKLVNEFL